VSVLCMTGENTSCGECSTARFAFEVLDTVMRVKMVYHETVSQSTG